MLNSVGVSDSFDPIDLIIKLSSEDAKTVQEFFKQSGSEGRNASTSKAFRIQRVNMFLTELERAVTGNCDAVAKYDEEDIQRFIAILKDDIGRDCEYHFDTSSKRQFEGDVPPGIAGLNALAILQLFEIAVADDTVFVGLSGKVRDYIFDQSANAGHVAVDVMISFFHSYNAFRTDTPDKTIVFHWDVEVLKDFNVHERQGDPINYPNNPYPNTVDFPPAGLDPKNKGSIWYRDLNRKIFARGDNSVIKVHHVYIQVDDEPIYRLPDGHHVYQSDTKSCVDLMFHGEPPARVLPPQKSYCLGRCDHPAILNTSGA